ncbi:MAG TPA: substrate-binding domain-containing protein, partial [Polyangiaceae bacterium]|nr:substrate-binding domain-containing protein [Polyangiaceae bacterium]
MVARRRLLLLVALLSAACDLSRPLGEPLARGEDQSRGRPAKTIALNGAGATFPYPLYSKWMSEYNRLNPEVRINYQSIGSGAGIAQVKAGTVDFGATDKPLASDDLAQSNLAQFPTIIGGIVP